jgi:hypothetical protein
VQLARGGVDDALEETLDERALLLNGYVELDDLTLLDALEGKLLEERIELTKLLEYLLLATLEDVLPTHLTPSKKKSAGLVRFIPLG